MELTAIQVELLRNALGSNRRRDVRSADEKRLLDQYQGAPRPFDGDLRHRGGVSWFRVKACRFTWASMLGLVEVVLERSRDDPCGRAT